MARIFRAGCMVAAFYREYFASDAIERARFSQGSREEMKLSDVTVRQLIEQIAAQFAAASLVYGHGTDNPLDEAAWLVFATLGLNHDDTETAYAMPVSDEDRALILERAERPTSSPRLFSPGWSSSWMNGCWCRVRRSQN